MIRIMLVGPLPPPMGGATRHFQTLLTDLHQSDQFQVELVNTSRHEGFNKTSHNLSVGMHTVWAIIKKLRNTDIISYHASDRGMFLFGPVIVFIARLARKPLILRMFGGSFGDFYAKRGRVGKTLIRHSIFKASVILLQTKRLINQLAPMASARLEWFSTYIKVIERDPQDIEPSFPDACTRFIFLGHMWRTKGVETMLEIADDLPSGTHLDLYGTLDEYTREDINQRGKGRVRYRGFLTHDEVDRTLWKYDCLVLPTFHTGEGYPGAIAEAFAHELPVITTKWLAIPEIVDSSCGLLIDPDSPQQLAAAIEEMHADADMWRIMKEGASSRAKDFNHSVWSKTFEDICVGLMSKKYGVTAP